MTEQTSTAVESSGPEGTAIYVYGIVLASDGNEGAESLPEAGPVVGGGEQAVRQVRRGKLAALVSELSPDHPLGKPEDLMAHARIVDQVAAKASVLPFKFGAVVTDEQAVKDELIGPNEDQFLSALKALDGQAEFLVKGRYIEEAVLREVLAENPDAGKLRDQIAGQLEDVTRDARIALGEVVNQAIEAKRQADTQLVAQMLEPFASVTNVREATNELDAAAIAVLAPRSQQKDIEQAVGELAKNWDGRVDITLFGPIAAYDFVVTQASEA
ncbi:GvpL/GvpF family gas vesicle protein [Hoyosella subflava]|nr:GvpL/GvpF family gas vesicle protein [Hoyosella subflava]